jgi:hypothetical protein
MRRVSLVLAVAGSCVLTGCSSSEGSGVITTTAPPATATSPPITAPPATPKYSIIGTSGKRYDGEPIYFVLIDPVDLSNDREVCAAGCRACRRQPDVLCAHLR